MSLFTMSSIALKGSTLIRGDLTNSYELYLQAQNFSQAWILYT